MYTTQHGTWLRAAVDCSPTQLVCFRSVKRWKTARQLLTSHPTPTLQVLFREQDETTPVLACRFVAELVEIHFADQFANDRARRAWLEDRLWLQRNKIKSHHPKYRTWQEQFKVEEIDNFMKAKTWFSVRDAREIKPLPLPRLRKLKDNRPRPRVATASRPWSQSARAFANASGRSAPAPPAGCVCGTTTGQ